MDANRTFRSRRSALVLAAAALALTSASTAAAHTGVVPDPDEPDLPSACDIEWAAVDHPPSVSGRFVRHTIKTMAPYANAPGLYLRTPDGSSYKLFRGKIYGSGLSPTRVIDTQTPAGAPDTISFTFDLATIGNPVSYEWRAVDGCGPYVVDYAPDAGWVEHYIGPSLVPSSAALAAPRPVRTAPSM
jgi:hypothetical protein